MNRQILKTLGIYDTAYRATFHRDGDVSVKVPYVRWECGTGNLTFKMVRTHGNTAKDVAKFFRANTDCLPANCFGGYATLSEVLEGSYKDLVIFEDDE